MSGEHNVRFFLRERGVEEHPLYIEKILAAAKRSNRLLTEADVMRMVTVMRERLKVGHTVEDSELEGTLSQQ
jgi:hypothetical protein